MNPMRATWVTQLAGGGSARSLGCYELKVIKGVDANTVVRVKQPRFRLGALEGNDLKLKDPSVSGHHVEILHDPNGFRVRDLGSKNGTLLNGVRIVDAFVGQHARISLGATELELTIVDEAIQLPVSAAESFGPLYGKSLPMRELFARLESFAKSEATVLITGETGTGKELVAEALVQSGPRAEKPLLVVDCGALAPTLVESELFGHEKGAFTGAHAVHPGVFERANGGTVFLDEIGELPLELQPRLLRVLERREVNRLGGKNSIPVDVRILAATHRALEEEVNSGRFRADLFYRLSVLRVEVPPLRDRKDDIPLLVSHLAGPRAGRLDAGTLSRFTEHSWPGNVRELRNAVERWLAGAQPIDKPAAAPAGASVAATLDIPFLEQKEALVDAFERKYLDALLADCGDNLSQGARKAGLSRMAVVKMLARHGR